jgi:hypothetical protein
MALQQAFLWFSFLFPLLAIVPPLLHTHHHRLLQCDILLTRKHFVTSSVFQLGASSQLRHLAGCSEQLFSTGGTRVWKSENTRGWITGNVSVITVTYEVTSFSLTDSTTTSTRSMNRKEKHAISSPEPVFITSARWAIVLTWNSSAFLPFAGQILVDWLINLRILFYFLFPILVLFMVYCCNEVPIRIL